MISFGQNLQKQSTLVFLLGNIMFFFNFKNLINPYIFKSAKRSI